MNRANVALPSATPTPEAVTAYLRNRGRDADDPGVVRRGRNELARLERARVAMLESREHREKTNGRHQ